MRLQQKALTFDDVLLVPAYSEVLPRDVVLKTKLTREITLNLPMIPLKSTAKIKRRSISISHCQFINSMPCPPPYAYSLISATVQFSTALNKSLGFK